LKAKKTQLLRLLEESGPKLYNMLTRLTLSDDIAEELMQDLFIKLFEIQHLRKIKNLEAYACRIAINLAFDWRRKKRTFAVILDNHPDPRIHQVDLKLIQQEDLVRVLNAIEQLPNQMRECVVLRYIEQMSYDQIAQRIQKNNPSVRVQCSKGLKRLRQILNNKNASLSREAINE
jgi:RNA polymerase sigma-70 factor (ECF subfamily)